MVPTECVPKGNPPQGSYGQERSKHSCGEALGLQAEMRDRAAVGEGQEGDCPGAEGDGASQQESVPQLFSKKGGFAETAIVSCHFSLGLVLELTVGKSVLPKCQALRLCSGTGSEPPQQPQHSCDSLCFLISSCQWAVRSRVFHPHVIHRTDADG